jgi:hypothetical protein
VLKQFAGHLERRLGVSHAEKAELDIAELAHSFAGIRLDDVRQSENWVKVVGPPSTNCR